MKSYVLGSTVTIRLVVSISPTTLMAPAAAGATTLTVADITGYADTNAIVILLGHPDEREERRVVSGSPSGNTITITAGLTWAHTVGEEVGKLASPTAATLTVRHPDGTTTAPSVTGSAGIYTAEVTPTMAGRHTYEWVTTVSGKGETEGAFLVLQPEVA